MKIKAREETKPYKEKLSSSFRYIYNKRTKILYSLLIIIIVFLAGIFFGLLIKGFFGTIDKPSPKMINLVHSLGIGGLSLQVFAKGVLAENVKIPFNYLSGLFSNPDRIYIDVAFTDYQKIAFKREEALERSYLITSDDDWVPAQVSDGNKNVRASIRLKGDRLDHWNTNKWSLRIKVSGDETLYGMKEFSIQHPKTRWWLHEFVYQNALKREEVLNVRYKFIEVIINGDNKGIYALEEHFAKQLLEYNNRRESAIIRFDESLIGLDFGVRSRDLYPLLTIDSFQSRTSLEDDAKSQEFDVAKNLLESFRLGNLRTSEVFDVDKLAKYFAVNLLFGADHASQWNNIRLYYNPITSKLEPIGFDANSGLLTEEMINEYSPKIMGGKLKSIEDFPRVFFQDKEFYERYVKELERVARKEYLDGLFKYFDNEIKESINIIHKSYPYYHFDKSIFYENQDRIRLMLDPAKAINAYYNGMADGNAVLYIGNIEKVPMQILSLEYNNETYDGEYLLNPYAEGNPVDYRRLDFYLDGIRIEEKVPDLKVYYKILGASNIKNETVLAWSYLPEDFLEKDFFRKKAEKIDDILDVDENEKTITFKSAIIDKDLVIPKGYKVIAQEGIVIDLVNNSLILSYSALDFRGSKEKPIKIVSSDKTGQGLVVQYALTSNFEYVQIDGLKAVKKENWQLTGPVNFYESDIKFDNVVISNINYEDTINVVRSNVEIKNSVFKDGLSDCFDGDFITGIIQDSLFMNCGNDGLDFSGSNITIKNIKAENLADKGISVGEKSYAIIINAEINKAKIGVTAKDLSEAKIDGLKISNAEYGLAVYMKKTEYGEAKINAENTEIEAENNYIVEKGSFLQLNGKIILDNKEDVFKKLYPNG